MARKRRTRYDWLQVVGSSGPAAEVNDTPYYRDFGNVVLAADGTSRIAIVDLLEDTSPDDLANVGAFPIGVSTLTDYLIKRIVGKVFVHRNISDSGSSAKAALVSVGLFIARSDDSNVAAGAENFPVGVSSAGINALFSRTNYGPLAQENARQPWIWRREWILGCTATQGQTAIAAFCPVDNTGYGSVADGPHIDAKTARRVGHDERLFAVMETRNYPLSSTASEPGIIRGTIGVRVLGKMLKSHNRSAF